MKKKKPVLHRVKTHHVRWILAIVFVFFSTAGTLFYWQLSGRTEQIAIERAKTQELIIARSGALSITEFLKERRTNLLLLAEIEAVKAGEEEKGRQVLRDLIGRLEGRLIANIVRVDKEGKTVWSENLEHEKAAEGVDVSDRDYFIWAGSQKGSGEVFFSHPLKARGGSGEGTWVMVMAAPVFYKNEFNGLVFVSFLLEDLTRKFITPLVSSSPARAFIVSQDGKVITSSFPEMIGKNAVEEFPLGERVGREEYSRVIERAFSGEEGSAIHSDYFSGGEDRVITAYSPLKVKGASWSLLVSVPYREAAGFLAPLKIGQSLGFVFCLIGVLILGVLFVLGVRIAQRESFVNGFIDGRDGVKSVTPKKSRHI